MPLQNLCFARVKVAHSFRESKPLWLAVTETLFCNHFLYELGYESYRRPLVPIFCDSNVGVAHALRATNTSSRRGRAQGNKGVPKDVHFIFLMGLFLFDTLLDRGAFPRDASLPRVILFCVHAFSKCALDYCCSHDYKRAKCRLCRPSSARTNRRERNVSRQ